MQGVTANNVDRIKRFHDPLVFKSDREPVSLYNSVARVHEREWKNLHVAARRKRENKTKLQCDWLNLFSVFQDFWLFEKDKTLEGKLRRLEYTRDLSEIKFSDFIQAQKWTLNRSFFREQNTRIGIPHKDKKPARRLALKAGLKRICS